MSKPNVLLTGGSGLLGRTLTPMLAARWNVTHLEMTAPGDGLPLVQADLRDADAVAATCDGMDAIVHVAALHGRAWSEAGDDVSFKVNVTGTKNIIEGAIKAGVKRIVFTSSIWATGHGPNPPYLPIDEDLPREPAELYGLTKVLGEAMCRYASSTHGISTIVIRPGGIAPADAYDAHNARYLSACVDVRDVAQAHKLALEAPESMLHEVFVVTAESPLCQVNPDTYREDPISALEAVVPGSATLAGAGNLSLPPDLEWYTVAKAKKQLGYRPEYNFSI